MNTQVVEFAVKLWFKEKFQEKLAEVNNERVGYDEPPLYIPSVVLEGLADDFIANEFSAMGELFSDLVMEFTELP